MNQFTRTKWFYSRPLDCFSFEQAQVVRGGILCSNMNGQQIKVNEARPRDNSGGGRGRGGGGYGGGRGGGGYGRGGGGYGGGGYGGGRGGGGYGGGGYGGG